VAAVLEDSGELTEGADVVHQRLDTCFIKVEGIGQLIVQFRPRLRFVVEQLVDVLYNLHASVVVIPG